MATKRNKHNTEIQFSEAKVDDPRHNLALWRFTWKGDT